ncbi:MAG TPA: methyltransferase [Gammaproteobacteria bacterium]|nr:methyltransferase [Gammaproteobacteria bacterium]
MFSSFAERSQEKELMDLGPDYYSHDEYIQCLKKLFQVNKLLGFFRNTVNTLKKCSKESTLLDIGCGGGLFILYLSRFFPQMKMHGVDVSPEAIVESEQSLHAWQRKNGALRVTFELQKNPELNAAKNSVDIILATLVCHHMSNEELVEFLRQAYLIANKAIIINDLHRHRLAYWLYAVISPLLFRNRLITHDGLISIRRGFTRAEWKLFLNQAGIENYELKWRFPFRWKLILWK